MLWEATQRATLNIISAKLAGARLSYDLTPGQCVKFRNLKTEKEVELDGNRLRANNCVPQVAPTNGDLPPPLQLTAAFRVATLRGFSTNHILAPTINFSSSQLTATLLHSG